MARAPVCQEENPDKEDAWLVEYYRMSRWEDLRDIRGETVTHAASYEEAHSVKGDIGVGAGLAECQKDIVIVADGRVTVVTLKWAHEELSWDKHH